MYISLPRNIIVQHRSELRARRVTFPAVQRDEANQLTLYTRRR